MADAPAARFLSVYPMKQVSIRPVWTIQDPPGPVLPARLSELLVHVAETGSLWQAARQLATEGLFLAAP